MHIIRNSEWFRFTFLCTSAHFCLAILDGMIVVIFYFFVTNLSPSLSFSILLDWPNFMSILLVNRWNRDIFFIFILICPTLIIINICLLIARRVIMVNVACHLVTWFPSNRVTFYIILFINHMRHKNPQHHRCHFVFKFCPC